VFCNRHRHRRVAFVNLKIKAEAAQGRQWKKYICMLSFNYCHHHVVVECNSQKGKGHWHFLQQIKKTLAFRQSIYANE
jgi:hypothetical protein